MLIPEEPLMGIEGYNTLLGKILVIRSCPEINLFLLLFEERFAIWQYDPLVPLRLSEKDSSSITAFGSNLDAAWKQDGSMFCVMTNKSWVYLYKMDGKITTQSDFQNLCLDQVCLFRISHPILCVECWNDLILIATNNSTIEIVKWPLPTFGVLERHSISLNDITLFETVKSQQPSNKSYAGHSICQMHSTSKGDIASIMSNGHVLLLSPKNDHYLQGKFTIIHGAKEATCLCVNEQYMDIIVGTSNGSILGFKYEEEEDKYVPKYQFACSPNMPLGSPVLNILWSPDGTTLVALWSNRAPVLFSRYGSHIISLEFNSEESTKVNFDHLFWTPSGDKLFLTSLNEKYSEMYIVKMLMVSNDKTGSIVLYGQNKIYLFISYIVPGPDSYSSDSPSPSPSLMISPLASQSNCYKIYLSPTHLDIIGSILKVSFSESSFKVAVLGKVGLLVFDLVDQIWIILNTNEIFSSSLTWFHDLLFYSIQGFHDYTKENSNIIGFYDLHTRKRISRSSVLFYTDPIISFSIENNLLFCFLSNKCDVFSLNYTHNEIKLSKILTCLDFSSISIDSIEGRLSTDDSNKLTVYCLSSGKLLRHEFSLNLTANHVTVTSETDPTSENKPLKLGENVEMFWTHEILGQTNEFMVIMFSGFAGLMVWCPGQDKSQLFDINSHLNLFEIPHISGPIAFQKDEIIIGCLKFSYPLMTIPLTCSSSSYNPKSILLLPHIIMNLIRIREKDRAIGLCKSFKYKPKYLQHILEIMLHNALEIEENRNSVQTDSYIKDVIDLTVISGLSLCTISHCLRKSTVSLWHNLFNYVDPPSTLFFKCLEEDNLSLAASYLILVQCLESITHSQRLAINLLDRAISSLNWDIVCDILRYVRSIESQYYIYSDHSENEDWRTEQSDILNSMQEKIEIYAENFFKAKKLKNLGLLIHYTYLDFDKFLKSPRAREAGQHNGHLILFTNLIDEFGAIFRQLLHYLDDKKSDQIMDPVVHILNAEPDVAVEASQILWLRTNFFQNRYLELWIVICLFIFDFSQIESVIFNSGHFSDSDKPLSKVISILLDICHLKFDFSKYYISEAVFVLNSWVELDLTNDLNLIDVETKTKITKFRQDFDTLS